MQVFKTYFKILKKRLAPLLIYGVLFLGITLMATSSYRNNKAGEFQVQKVPVTVVNEDGQSELTDGFLKYLEKYVTYIKVDDTKEARKDALFYRKVHYIITIPAGFAKSFLAGDNVSLTKQTIPDSIEAVSVDNAVNNYFNTVKLYLKHVPDINYDELNSYVEQNLQEQTQVTFDLARQDSQRNSDEFNKFYYNYLGYIIIAVFIVAVSTIMLSYQDINIRRRHNASPVTIRSMNLQLLFGNLIFAFCYLAVFLTAGYFFNPFRKLDTNLVLSWINASVFAVVALSISYLVGITVSSKKAVSAISTAVSLSLAFISGMFVPQEYLGAAVLKVASFTPSYWYIRANNTIQQLTSYEWGNISDIFGMMAIQIGFAAAIISVALVISKRKSQQAN
jgi:ABC-2 type transport system permease protein